MGQPQKTQPQASSSEAVKGPLFVVFEGADGTGKTTHLARLGDRLEGSGTDVVRLREPTNGTWGTRIREAARRDQRPLPGEELMWFVLDRLENVEKNIKPALAAGKVVLQDRYFFSTAAYQGVYGDIDPRVILQMHAAFAPSPDLIIHLMCPTDLALARIQKERGVTDSFERHEFQRQVAKAYEEKVYPWHSASAFLQVETAAGDGAIEEQAQRIYDAVRNMRPKGTSFSSGVI